MTLRQTAALAWALGVLPALSCWGRGADLEAQYEGHRWFALRGSLRKEGGSGLHRLAVAAAFNGVRTAESEDAALLRSATPADATAVRETISLMIGLYGHNARYRDVGSVLPKNAVADPKTAAAFAAFGQLPDLTRIASGRSRIRCTRDDGYLIAPVSVNGRPTRLLLDTGAEISLVTESEAARLSLEAQAGGISAPGSPATRHRSVWPWPGDWRSARFVWGTSSS